MSVLVIDRSGFTITRREMTDEGFLKVPGKVARIGIQQYLASELGLTDRQPNEVINVYRPAEEVFNPNSLASYDNKDVTNDHPSDMVTADTFKDVAVGHAMSVGRPEGEFVVVDLLIKDKQAIDAVNAGKVELSAGYLAEYVAEPGTFDGQPYEFVQRGIRINHIALVDRARAGKQARLYDHGKRQERPMFKVTLDKKSEVEVADKATATLIQSTIDGLRLQLEDTSDELKKARDEAEAEKAKAEKKDEELEKEKEKSSDAAITKRIQELTELRDSARKIAGEKFQCDSMLPLEIKRAALAVVRPNKDWANQSEVYINASWDMEAEKSEDELEEEKSKRSTDALGKDFQRHYIGDNNRPVGDSAMDNFLHPEGK